jgi:hypothetical protein
MVFIVGRECRILQPCDVVEGLHHAPTLPAARQ